MEKLCQHCSYDGEKPRRSNRRISYRYHWMEMVRPLFCYSGCHTYTILTSYRSFLGQCPPTILALVLVAYKLNVASQDEEEHNQKNSHVSKLRRVDFLGAFFLSASITCGLLVLELGGQRMPWTHPMVLGMLGTSLVTGNLFLLTEAFWAKEPIFPLRLLLNRDVVTSYINLGFQSGAQMSVSTYTHLHSR